MIFSDLFLLQKYNENLRFRNFDREIVIGNIDV